MSLYMNTVRRYRNRMIWACAVAGVLAGGNGLMAQHAPDKLPASPSPYGQIAQSNAPAQEPTAAPATAPAQAAATIQIYTLQNCIDIAFEKQPAVAAARATLKAKQINRNALAKMSPAASLFVSDLNIRKQQSAKGVCAAEALLMQTESETTYAVTRTYFTAIYARMQQDVASGVVDNLSFYRDLVSRIIKAGSDRDINQGTLDRLDIYIGLAKSKQVDAENGVQRALAALREAMGISTECITFQLADVSLPEPNIVPERCDIINAALARRGEMMTTLLAADVFRLEVDAQGKHRFSPKVQTFAALSDIHAQPVPPGLRNGDYRPGAIGLEMPSTLAGNRETRKKLACAYSERADAVVAKTRELIILEAEDAYLKWADGSRKLASSRDSATVAKRLARQTREDANNGAKIKEGEILQTDILAGQATAAYYEAAFQQVLALSGLERITAGGFTPNLSNPQR